MAEYEKQCAPIKAWHDLQATVFARVYRRTDDHGKQALQNELDRIMGLVMSREISARYLPRLLGGPANDHHPTISDKYRAVLFASDGTVVGLLDALREIARQRPAVQDILEDLPAVCAIWEDEHRGCCPFWGRLTKDEQHDAVSNLKNVVQLIGSDASVLGGHETTIRMALETMKTRGTEYKHRRDRPPSLAERIANNRRLHEQAADLEPHIAHLPSHHPHAEAHRELMQQIRDEDARLALQHGLHLASRQLEATEYRSLSHRLLDQPLSSRKARIYGMI
ncbi:hypothetical protein NBRC10513_004264 [Rhodotorula toruloides]